LLSSAGVERLLWGYCFFAFVTMALFSKRKLAPVAWCALLVLNLLKSLILFQDYRLRLNQHYMTYWVTLAFLFVPYKRRAISYLVASFYFWAGTLKFTPDWFSGAALFGRAPLGVPQSLIPASCIYVVFLELVVTFGLLIRNRWIFWCALIQFIAFHIASWPIVQFFYPTLMLSILTIFPLARYIADPAKPEAKRPLGVDLRGFFRGPGSMERLCFRGSIRIISNRTVCISGRSIVYRGRAALCSTHVRCAAGMCSIGNSEG